MRHGSVVHGAEDRRRPVPRHRPGSLLAVHAGASRFIAGAVGRGGGGCGGGALSLDGPVITHAFRSLSPHHAAATVLCRGVLATLPRRANDDGGVQRQVIAVPRSCANAVGVSAPGCGRTRRRRACSHTVSHREAIAGNRNGLHVRREVIERTGSMPPPWFHPSLAERYGLREPARDFGEPPSTNAGELAQKAALHDEEEGDAGVPLVHDDRSIWVAPVRALRLGLLPNRNTSPQCLGCLPAAVHISFKMPIRVLSGHMHCLIRRRALEGLAAAILLAGPSQLEEVAFWESRGHNMSRGAQGVGHLGG